MAEAFVKTFKRHYRMRRILGWTAHNRAEVMACIRIFMPWP
jgi:hypothetical protein